MLRVQEDDLEWDDNNLPSYQGEPFTGESVETMPDGRLLSLTTYVDGLDEGPFRVWSGDGVLVVEGTSRRGRPVGVSREWYPNGAPKIEREYSEQGELLRYRSWDEDGTVTEDYVRPRGG
jgi:antitoxin component YwqK of YwqJK toxin-antitoxin module